MRHGGQGQPWGFRSQKALRRLLPLPPPPPSLPQPPPQEPPPPPLPGRERGGAGPPPSGQRRANWRGRSAHAGARLPLPHNPPLIPKRTNTPRGPPALRGRICASSQATGGESQPSSGRGPFQSHSLLREPGMPGQERPSGPPSTLPPFSREEMELWSNGAA
ncbi:basic salivary proline-rich protein 1-like [Gorilla gorilla gorilla]|uniref:basic salivary proline-rich protein 1-like n=1 Tax=Gorilla gorilla gorilla TaxID=9595 RepID=UPI002445CF36|nr:basic salivary proline-rich protein 1-like [Gorilla gorilla gorilla]